MSKQAVLRGKQVPRTLSEATRWQSPPIIYNVKQYEIVLSFKVSLFILVFFRQKKSSANEDRSLLVNALLQNYRVLL